MISQLSKKIVAGLILTVFSFSNTAVCAFSMGTDTKNSTEESIKLRADVSITDANEPITLSLRDSDVKQVLRMFADKAGMNIMFDQSVSGTVTLDLVNIPLNEAFEMVLNMAKLNYYITNNTLIIAGADADINLATQEIFTVPVKYMNAAAMASFLNKNIFTKKKPGLSGRDVVSTNPMTNELIIMGNSNDAQIAQKMVDKFDKKPTSTQIKVSHTTPAQMADMICKMLIPATSGNKTGAAANIDGIMTGGAANLGIEVGGGDVACSVTSEGVIPFQSLTISYFPQVGTVGIMGGSEEQQEMVKEFIANNDKKQPQAYLEVSIIELNENGSKEFTNTWQYISNNFSFNYSNGSFSTNPNLPFFVGGGDTYPVFPTTNSKGVPDYWMNRYNGPTSLVYAVNYLIENQKGRVVANPRILITNGQESVIDLTSDYVKKQTSQFIDSVLSGAAQRTYDIGNDNGIKISITPFISPDGYVTLNINPDYATIASQITTPSSGGPTYPDDIQVTLLKRRNLKLKNVRIKDGETLVIGGLIREGETKSVSKLPFLGDLPGIGMFFRSTTTSKTKEEMVIMITPKIITDDEDAVTAI